MKVFLLLIAVSITITLCNSCNLITKATSAPENVTIPHGTYTSTFLGAKATLTFTSTTLTTYNPIDGKAVYTYTISADGRTIDLVNVATGQKYQEGPPQYAYSVAYDIVTLDGVQYFK